MLQKLSAELDLGRRGGMQAREGAVKQKLAC
jgi:hypothetical protein